MKFSFFLSGLFIAIFWLSVSTNQALADVVVLFDELGLALPNYKNLLNKVRPGDELQLLHGERVKILAVVPRKDGTSDNAGARIFLIPENKVILLPRQQAHGSHVSSETLGYDLIEESGVSHARIDTDLTVPGRYLVQENIDVKFTLLDFINESDSFREHPKLIDALIDFSRKIYVFSQIPDGVSWNIVWNGNRWILIDWDGISTIRRPHSAMDVFFIEDFSWWTDEPESEIKKRNYLTDKVLVAWREESQKDEVAQKILKLKNREKAFPLGVALKRLKQRIFFARYLYQHYSYKYSDFSDVDYIASSYYRKTSTFHEKVWDLPILDSVFEKQLIHLIESEDASIGRLAAQILMGIFEGRVEIAKRFYRQETSIDFLLGVINKTSTSRIELAIEKLPKLSDTLNPLLVYLKSNSFSAKSCKDLFVL